MLKLPALFVAFILLTSHQAGSPTAMPSGAEFPPQDQPIWMSVRRGLVARLVAQRLAEAPDSLQTVRLLVDATDFDGLLRALRLIVDTDPRRIADAFHALGDAVWQFRSDDEATRQRRETLQQIVADARKRLQEVPREEAARAERVFVSLDRELSGNLDDWPERLALFIEQYRGTEAALLAEVDVISSPPVSKQVFDALDAVIDAHPGTTAAAMALYMKGFQWHTTNTLGTLEPRGADPTDRFMRVLSIVTELESGRYPQSEWVDKAPSLIIDFFIPEDAKIAPENINRLLDAYGEFARTHLVLRDESPDQSGIGYLVTTKMADLFKPRGERVVGIERILAELERSATDPAAVRYLRAMFYLRRFAGQPTEERQAMLAKAQATLTALSAEGRELYHRKALATLASLEFAEGNYEKARDAFRRYSTSYPRSNWTWVAFLRTGQCDEELGDPNGAVAAYLEAANTYPDLPPARVLGQEYAARTYESIGEFEKAVLAHQRALEAWDNAFGVRYSTFLSRSSKTQDPFVMSTDIAEVTRQVLSARIAQLKQSLSMPSGVPLERGRWLLGQGRYDEARTELQRIVAQHPTSPAAPQARYLAHRAQLERALQLADVDHPDSDEAAAMHELDALAHEPHDFAVTAANIARAGILWKEGEAAAAEKVMMNALEEWHAHQRIKSPTVGLEEDVAEIRRAVFLPLGGGVYAGSRWNAFTWPLTSPLFFLINADVSVKRHDGEIIRVTLVQSFSGADKALFFDTEQIGLLQRTIVKLGGTLRRGPQQILETPNQPAGDSMQILELWNRFFQARPAHWGGWAIETYPVITQIEFTDAERTKAAVRVTIGYSGAAVELEKENGKWTPKRLTNQWIT